MLEKLKEEYKKNNFRFAISMSFIITLVFTVLYLFMGPSFETNDDWSIAWQLSRGAGDLASFLSPILSLIFSYLYAWFPTIPWWSLFLFFSGCFLLFTLLYITTKHFSGRRRYFFYIFWFVIIWLVCIKYMNFTRTALALSLSGGLWVIQSLSEDKKEKTLVISEIVLGLFIFSIGFMVRFQAACISIPFLLLTLGYYYLCFSKNKNEKRECLLKVITKAALLIGVLIVVQLSTMISWDMRPDWKNYLEYNTARSSIQDYAKNYPTWEEATKEYQDLGFKKNDEKMVLFEWFTEDTAVYSKNVLEEMGLLYQSSSDKLQIFKDIVKTSLYNTIFWITFLFFIYVLYKKRDKEASLIAFMMLLSAAALILYFSFLGRMVLRIYEPTLLCVIVCIFLFLQFPANNYRVQNRNEKSLYLTIGTKIIEDGCSRRKTLDIPLKMMLLLLLCIVPFFFIMKEELKDISPPTISSKNDENVRLRMDYLDSAKDRIYLIPTLSDNWALAHGIWEAVPPDYCSNLFFLGGWMARTPTNVNNLADLNINNPAKSLFLNDRVFSINDTEVFSYLKRHYGQNITCTQVDAFPQAGGKVIVKYSSPVMVDENIIDGKKYAEKTSFAYIPELDVWNLKINEKSNFANLYCNLVINGETYSFFLEDIIKNKYEGYFIDFTQQLLNEIDDAYLLGKSNDGKLVYLGSIFDVIVDVVNNL